MYIFELIAKLVKNKKTITRIIKEEIDYNETCNHSFLPIDSTGKTLACTKCGLVVKKEDIKTKPKNPFV